MERTEANNRQKNNQKTLITPIDETSFDKTLCLHKLIYGINLLKLTTSSKSSERRFYLHEGTQMLLTWVSPKKSSQSSSVPLSQVHKIELGGVSEKFTKYKLPFEKHLAVTLYHLKGSLDVVFTDPEDLNLWVAGIQYIIKQGAGIHSKENVMLRAWTKADANNSGSLNFEEVKGMMKSLNIFVNEQEVQRIFETFDVDHSGTIDKKEFEKLIEQLMQKPEIEEIFANCSGGKSILDYEDFRYFMQSCQRDKDSEIFSSFCGNINNTMNFETFRDFLLNPEFNSIVSRKEEKVHMDMSSPLSHYYIASSHNTYLEGNQLTGTSSTQQYARVLLEGCRCVEIDAWDGNDNEPVVTHGHTLVNKINLRLVAEEIYKSAFITSPYPVIISLENHCSYEQTGKIGVIFQEVFGNAIYKPAEHLLIPDELKYKFIIKAKAPGVTDKKNSEECAHKDLAAVTGMSGCHFSFNLAFNSIVSLSERKMTSMVKQHGASKITGFNVKSFMRIYPKALRINSSNYNPVLSWCHGAQVVAINYQYRDFGRLLNSCLFSLNGKAGYVLKPALLRKSTGVDFASDRFKRPKIKFSIQIISASNLPKAKGSDDIVCPAVEICAFGIKADEATWTTRAVDKNGFNPVWKEVFHFYFRFPDFCFLIFNVVSKKNKLCQNAVFVPSCAQGYRVIDLFDENLEKVEDCSLFVKVERNADFEFEGDIAN